MNSLMTEQGEWLKGTHGLRAQLLGVLTDADLKFSLPGNPTLGEMFREEAEIERSYADSFKTFKQTFESPKRWPFVIVGGCVSLFHTPPQFFPFQ